MKYLLAGHSHTNCIKRAIENEREIGLSKWLKVINFNCDKDFVDSEGSPIFESLKEYPEVVCLSLWGNFHNVLGIAEHDLPFNISGQNGNWIDDLSRSFIPYQLGLATFRQRHSRVAVALDAVIKKFLTAKIILICPPPPIANMDFLRENPGIFDDKIKSNGFVPAEIRENLFEITQQVYASIALEKGVAFLPPPHQAFDNGFLSKEFYGNDPTHGNIEYGRLVLKDIYEMAGEQ